MVDGGRRPIGLVTRADLVNPQPRRVLLVDHAEQAQSVVGVEHAEIVEILDHHHIGSIETRVPVRATFDPVGSTATLVIERFRQIGHGADAGRRATLLLGAVLSDTVILNSPTTTERDHAVVDYLEQVLAVDPTEFGREMFENTSDLTRVPADEIVKRDAKDYEARRPLAADRPGRDGRPEPRRAARRAARGARRRPRARGPRARRRSWSRTSWARDSRLYVSGEQPAVERAFGRGKDDGVIDLPGVMSRKKQVAPPLLAALSG